MVTTSSNIMGGIDTSDTIMTNKGPRQAPKPVAPVAPVVPSSTIKKCAKCDESLKEADEQCPKCFALCEDARTLLLD